MDLAERSWALVLAGLGLALAARVVGVRAEVARAAAAHAALEARTAELEATRALRAEVEARREAIKRLAAETLPLAEEATPERLLEQLQDACERSGYRLRSILCNGPRPPRPTPDPLRRLGIEEVRVSLPGEGTLEQGVRLLAELEARPGVHVGSFRFRSAGRGVDRLLGVVEVVTYRLDPDR